MKSMIGTSTAEEVGEAGDGESQRPRASWQELSRGWPFRNGLKPHKTTLALLCLHRLVTGQGFHSEGEMLGKRAPYLLKDKLSRKQEETCFLAARQCP